MRRRPSILRDLSVLLALHVALTGSAAIPLSYAIYYDTEPAPPVRGIERTHRRHLKPPPPGQVTTLSRGSHIDQVDGAGSEMFRDIDLLAPEEEDVFGPQLSAAHEPIVLAGSENFRKRDWSTVMAQGP